MSRVIPVSILKQLSKMENTPREYCKKSTIAHRKRLYKDRPLTKTESALGYKKCPICGFPTKNRYRCHSCWDLFLNKEEDNNDYYNRFVAEQI